MSRKVRKIEAELPTQPTFLEQLASDLSEVKAKLVVTKANVVQITKDLTEEQQEHDKLVARHKELQLAIQEAAYLVQPE